MDLDLLQKIRDETTEKFLREYQEKSESNDFCGLVVHGGTDPFTRKEYFGALASFRLFSERRYPLYIFLNPEARGDVEKIAEEIGGPVYILDIGPLLNAFAYNAFMINSVFRLLPSTYQNVLTFQSDGFLIKKGWEEYVTKFPYIGAWWKHPVSFKQSKVRPLPYVSCGNGGFSFRKLNVILNILRKVNELGGQPVIEGQYIDYRLVTNNHWVAEDAFFSVWGRFFEEIPWITKQEADTFSIEPITFKQYQDKVSFGFHKIDE